MRQPPRVLIIDDHAIVRETLSVFLQHYGYAVDQAENGATGLQTARETAPDLIVTNLEMPEIDGYTLLVTAKRDSALRTVPVIILSFAHKPGDQRRCLEAGAFAFVDKTSPVDELLKALERVVRMEERRGEGGPA